MTALERAADRLHVLNISGGVQSSTLAYMAHRGELPVDLAVFADTKWENDRTYAQVEKVRALLEEAGIDFRWIEPEMSVPDRFLLKGAKRYVTMPVWTVMADGTAGKMREICTYEFKIAPIRRLVREVMTARDLKKVTQFIGISFDERRRVRLSDVKYIDLRYPLVELEMTREDCLAYAEENGYPEPPQTSCIGCPFHDNVHWRYIRDHEPHNWQNAIEVDRAIRRGGPNGKPLAGQAFLHRSKVPLEEADLRTEEEKGQEQLFDPGEGLWR